MKQKEVIKMTPKEMETALHILYSQIQKINKRTKKHTLDIKKLEKQMKEIEI